jgi:hypothetical protein
LPLYILCQGTYVGVDKGPDVESALGSLDDARFFQEAERILDNFGRDRTAVQWVAHSLQPSLDVFLRIAKLPLDILHVRAISARLRIEPRYVVRELCEKRPDRVRGCSDRVGCDEPRRPRSGYVPDETGFSSVDPWLGGEVFPHERAGGSIVDRIDQAVDVVVHFKLYVRSRPALLESHDVGHRLASTPWPRYTDRTSFQTGDVIESRVGPCNHCPVQGSGDEASNEFIRLGTIGDSGDKGIGKCALETA